MWASSATESVCPVTETLEGLVLDHSDARESRISLALAVSWSESTSKFTSPESVVIVVSFFCFVETAPSVVPTE